MVELQSIKDTSQNYKEKRTKTIDEAGIVDINMDVRKESAVDNNGKGFEFMVTTIGETDYRIPWTVLKQLKTHLKENPDLEKFKVTKEGVGLNSEYTVIPQ